MVYGNRHFGCRLGLGQHDDLPSVNGLERRHILETVLGGDLDEADPAKFLWGSRRRFGEPESGLARHLLGRQPDAILQVRRRPRRAPTAAAFPNLGL